MLIYAIFLVWHMDCNVATLRVARLRAASGLIVWLLPK